jgi:hypothetical protein
MTYRDVIKALLALNIEATNMNIDIVVKIWWQNKTESLTDIIINRTNLALHLHSIHYESQTKTSPRPR